MNFHLHCHQSDSHVYALVPVSLEKTNAHLLSCLFFKFLCPINWSGPSSLLLPQPRSTGITATTPRILCIHFLLGTDKAIVFHHFLNTVQCKQSVLGYTVEFIIVRPIYTISNLWVSVRGLKWQGNTDSHMCDSIRKTNDKSFLNLW